MQETVVIGSHEFDSKESAIDFFGSALFKLPIDESFAFNTKEKPIAGLDRKTMLELLDFHPSRELFAVDAIPTNFMVQYDLATADRRFFAHYGCAMTLVFDYRECILNAFAEEDDENID
jgi:predicted Zn-dependent protease with MMP-like domain